MNGDRPEITALLTRSRSALSEAKLLIDNNYFNAAANRIYYACFYAITALLISNDIKAKTHSGVKQMFGAHFISTGLVSMEAGRLYTEVFEMRQEGDYEFQLFFEAEDVIVLLNPTKQLVTEVEAILSKQQ